MAGAVIIIALIFMLAGFIVILVSGIRLLIYAFEESIAWGLGYMFVPFVNLAFIFMHWDKCGKWFFINLGGGALIIVAVVMVPVAAKGHSWKDLAKGIHEERKKTLHQADFRLEGFKDLAGLNHIAQTIASAPGVEKSDVSYKRPYWAAVVYDANETNFSSILMSAKLDDHAEVIDLEDKSIENTPDNLKAGAGKPELTVIGGLPLLEKTNDALSAGTPGVLFFGDSKSKDSEAKRQAEQIRTVYQKFGTDSLNFSVVDVHQPDNEEQRALVKKYYKGKAPLVVVLDRTRTPVWTKHGSIEWGELVEHINKVSSKHLASAEAGRSSNSATAGDKDEQWDTDDGKTASLNKVSAVPAPKTSEAPRGDESSSAPPEKSNKSEGTKLETPAAAKPAPAAEPPGPKDVLEALKTYDVESLETRIADMPPGTRWQMYTNASGEMKDPKRIGEIYAMHGLAEMYGAAVDKNQSHASMKYSAGLQRILNGGVMNPAIYQQNEFRTATKKVFTKCGLSEKLAVEFCDKGAKHQAITISSYNPAEVHQGN